jgi:hypothetical protein
MLMCLQTGDAWQPSKGKTLKFQCCLDTLDSGLSMDTVVPEWDLPGINLPPPPVNKGQVKAGSVNPDPGSMTTLALTSTGGMVTSLP